MDQYRALQSAKHAALEAGKLLLEYHGKRRSELHVETKSSATDLVSQADKEAQELIITLIQANFPDHRFFGEEDGSRQIGPPESEWEWIIDPLDGTRNFLRGKDNWGTIIALRHKSEVVLGVIHMPVFKETIVAVRGGGCTVNDQPVTLRDTASLSDAVLCCDLMHRARKNVHGVMIPAPLCGDIENYGCAADEIRHILRGWNDGAFFLGARLWDVAAGCLMLEEAGGKAFLEEHPERGRGGTTCVIATKPIFDELLTYVQKIEQDE